MVVIDPGTPERHGRDGIWCDPCLEPVIRALNAGGVRTVASCCGHGRRDGSICLADGRELVVRTFVPFDELQVEQTTMNEQERAAAVVAGAFMLTKTRR